MAVQMTLTRWFKQELLKPARPPKKILDLAEREGYNREEVLELAHEYGLRESDDKWEFYIRRMRLYAIRHRGGEEESQFRNSRKVRDEIARWLHRVLQEPRSSEWIYARGLERGYSRRSMAKIAREIGVVKSKPSRRAAGSGTQTEWKWP